MKGAKRIMKYGYCRVSTKGQLDGNSIEEQTNAIQTVNSMKYHTQKIKAQHGIIFKYHYLRHTYGTRLAMLNTPMHILCNQMGHASGNVTQKYYLGNSKEGLDILRNNLNLMN